MLGARASFVVHGSHCTMSRDLRLPTASQGGPDVLDLQKANPVPCPCVLLPGPGDARGVQHKKLSSDGSQPRVITPANRGCGLDREHREQCD